MGDGLVDYHIETPDKVKSIFQNAGVSTPSYNKLKLNNQQSIDTFKKAIAKAKKSLGNDGTSVELKDDYTDINLYLSEDGESGFGIKPNGDIVSVFSSKKVKGRSAHMLEMAISQGGRQLDCFDIYLTKIYETHGFKPVAKMKWNDEYIPEGWNKENFKDYNNGEPALTAGRRHVVFMVYDPNTKKDNEIPYIVDYDDGDKIQQKYFAKNKVDSLIDAKKKEREFKESDVNRDADGKFAKKNSSKNKSNDNDKKDNDKKENDKKENSNPKKSNCNIGDTYHIAINDMATIPAKKIAESNSYELYDEKDYFNKLNSKKKQDLENALQYASEKYDELFNIYGLSDSQPTNKLKVVLISQKDYKDMKGAAGFTLRAGASEEDSNNIFVNIDTIKKNDMNYINEVLLHETMHSIINDNLRNAKTNERPSKILEEALAETATFIANDKNYRDTDNPKALLFNKYYFTSNLMHYFYLKNNKNSDIFKDIIEKRQTRFMDAVQDIGNKVGIQGSKADIIKQFLKDKCNITDSDATMFILDLERKMKNPNW